MNPGKVVDPSRITDNLRLGIEYRPRPVKTHFRFPHDEGSFANATIRCVGVSRCRRLDTGTMCPSFMVTREEMNTTRGRARLLFEMREGNPASGGWRNNDVKEALELGLACKACKSECPVGVDIATYKAEFLSHYYQGRLRPAAAYSMGLIPWWSRLAAIAPSVANFISRSPGLSSAVKRVGGVAPERRIPRFAPATFVRMFRSRSIRNWEGPPVLLWPDTFNNHFHPGTAIAALDILETAGYRVLIPDRWVCCGRPLYDYGMLTLAKRVLS